MERKRRLTQKRRFSAVHTKGRRWSNALLGLRVLGNEGGVSRYGFSVGKFVGKAVVRNKVKRLLREAARLTPVLEGCDLVFTARAGTASASFWQIKGAVEDLLGRARLLAKGGSQEMGPPGKARRNGESPGLDHHTYL